MTEVPVELQVNGRDHQVVTSARTTLADLLRDQLGCTGVHLGCEHGACGACTVLVDGRSVRACVTLAAQAHGCEVTTVEGLSPSDGTLSDLQEALSAAGGLQCGFCTPGFVVAATELLASEPSPDEHTVREALSGNLCRCTGYEGIVRAVLAQGSDRPVQPSSWGASCAPGSAGPSRPPTGPPSDSWKASAPAPDAASAAATDTKSPPDPSPDQTDRRPAVRWALAAAAAAGLVIAALWYRQKER